jgi:hypothetical protein
MNKYEKLIEYIINDEDQKARDLFHEIVVEKSREIYESIMDEEDVHGQQVDDLVDEISHDESHAMENDEEGEDMEVGDQDDDLADMQDIGDEEGEEFGDEHGEQEHDDQIMNIDAKLDELLAKFDDIMGDKGEDSADEFDGDAEGSEDHDELDADGGDFDESMMEGVCPECGHDPCDCDDEEDDDKEAKTESRKNRSTSEIMREYVDKIGDIYGGEGDDKEGTIVGANTGAKDKANINKKSEVGPGADFGGEAKNIVRGGQNTIPDGTKPNKGEDNVYKKGEGKLIGKVGNTPGGDKKLADEHHSYETQHDSEGENVGAKDTMGRNINKKSEISKRVR